MAASDRQRMMSQSSTSSDDSSMVDVESAAYAKVVGFKGEKSSKLHFRLTVLSLGISVVCLLVLGAGLVMVIHSARFESDKACEESKVCMPCDQLNPSPLAEKESPLLRQLDVHVETRGEKETLVCCASTPAQYATLFKLVLTRQEEVKALADIIGTGTGAGNDNDTDTGSDDSGVVGRRTVSAHLLTKPTPRHFTDNMGNRLQQWKSPSESPLSHTAGVKFLHNKLYVQSPGIYFVYCQILYNRPNGDDSQEEDEDLMGLASHYVKRYSLLRPPSSGFLLKARHTRVSGTDDRHSSYVGGLFYLHPGDQLYVQVSVPQMVSHDDTASFFGLFKVSN